MERLRVCCCDEDAKPAPPATASECELRGGGGEASNEDDDMEERRLSLLLLALLALPLLLVKSTPRRREERTRDSTSLALPASRSDSSDSAEKRRPTAPAGEPRNCPCCFIRRAASEPLAKSDVDRGISPLLRPPPISLALRE